MQTLMQDIQGAPVLLNVSLTLPPCFCLVRFNFTALQLGMASARKSRVPEAVELLRFSTSKSGD